MVVMHLPQSCSSLLPAETSMKQPGYVSTPPLSFHTKAGDQLDINHPMNQGLINIRSDTLAARTMSNPWTKAVEIRRFQALLPSWLVVVVVQAIAYRYTRLKLNIQVEQLVWTSLKTWVSDWVWSFWGSVMCRISIGRSCSCWWFQPS